MLKDERAGVMVFSAMIMFALILFVAHTINVSDLTNEKIRIQDAVDATAYSGARVRANLYNSMGFLNMAKAALYRLGYANASNSISPGQLAILAQFSQLIPGFEIDYGDGFDKATWQGMGTADKLNLADLADQAQSSIALNFQDIITEELQRIAASYNMDELKFLMGQNPTFYQIPYPSSAELYPPPDYILRPDYISYIWSYYPDFYRFCEHVTELQHWIEPEPLRCPDCDPWQSWMDYEYLASGPTLEILLQSPWYQFPPPRIIGHAPSSTDNTLKAAVWKDTKGSLLFPQLFTNPAGGIWGYASAGAFTDRIRSLDSYYNLYVTDFVAKLVSLQASAFFEYMSSELPELPDLPEDFYVH